MVTVYFGPVIVKLFLLTKTKNHPYTYQQFYGQSWKALLNAFDFYSVFSLPDSSLHIFYQNTFTEVVAQVKFAY